MTVLIDSSEPPRRKRNRAREDASKSETSWKKHDLIRTAAIAQAFAMHHGIGRRGGRGIIIDMHAGDGKGVEQPQISLFGDNPSRTTAELAVTLADKIGADVVLCEKDGEKRSQLVERWPSTQVLSNHSDITGSILPAHRWALVLNDPCGPRDHGVDQMQAIAKRVTAADFIIVLNEIALQRMAGVKDARYAPAMSAYRWMSEPREWAERLGRRQIAISRSINGSQSFRYRVLVAADVLTRQVAHSSLFEVIQCK